MNHLHDTDIPGASLEASVIISQVLASMIAGVTTEVTQTDDAHEIQVHVLPVDTGIKFTFVLPSASAVAGVITADIAMSDTSHNPVQNKVIKAYVDGRFWTGTAAQYALLEDNTNIICFLSDTNIIMYNGESYSLSTHTHGNLSYAGAIGVLAGMVVMTGENGVLETVTVAQLKELLGASSGMNLLHNAEFASPFNTKNLTIYNTAGESINRWNLLGGTLTVNSDHITLSQAAINTAQLRQHLPDGSYERLMGQTLALSVLLTDNETVYVVSGIIDGVASTIASMALTNGYTARLIVDNAAHTAYVEINGGATVAALDISRIKLEIGSTSSIEDGVTDAALDWARLKLYALDGTIAPIVTDFVQFTAQTLTVAQKTQARANIGAPSVADIPTTPADIGAAGLAGGVVTAVQARCLVQTKYASFTLGANDAEKLTLLYSASAIVVTLPLDSTYDFPIGTAFNFIRWNSGAVAFTIESGVSYIAVNGSTSISAYGSAATIVKVGSNMWWLVCG